MAKVHILTIPTSGLVNAACHFETPAGDNAAGATWRDVLAATGQLGAYGTVDEAGVRTPYMGVGAAEVIELEAGNVLEIVALLHDSEVPDPVARKAALEVEADRAIATWQTRYSRRHDYYSLSFGTVS